MKYHTFTYGTGVLYGTTAVLDSISPETGPSTGGSQFIARGINMEHTSNDDDFTSVGLDILKWTSLVSGAGATLVSEGPLDPNLKFTTGTLAGNVSGIETKTIYVDSQFETRVRIGALSSYPATKANLYTMQLYVDANNHAEIEVNVYASNEVLLECVITKGGVQSAYYQDVNWTTGLSTFKMLRWDTTMYFYANGSLVFQSDQFVTTAAKYRFFNTNLLATYSVVNTLLLAATYKTFIVFGDRPVHDTQVVGDSRVRGLVPASIDANLYEAAHEGLVDVSLVSESTSTLSDAYDYYYLDSLTLIDNSQYGVKLSKRDDSTVRTPDLDNIGLGGGK